MTGEQNLRLIREIEANREFLLLAYSQNASLLAGAEQRIKELFEPLPSTASTVARLGVNAYQHEGKRGQARII